MADEPTRTERPKESLPAAVQSLVDAWSAMAEASADIAHARRALFLAYVAEGFTEAQAIELIKTL